MTLNLVKHVDVINETKQDLIAISAGPPKISAWVFLMGLKSIDWLRS